LSTDAPAPGKFKLMRTLWQVDNAGNMTSGGSTPVFGTADIARIFAWIAAGGQATRTDAGTTGANRTADAGSRVAPRFSWRRTAA